MSNCPPILLQGKFNKIQHRRKPGQPRGTAQPSQVPLILQELLSAQTDEKFKGRPANLLVRPGNHMRTFQ